MNLMFCILIRLSIQLIQFFFNGHLNLIGRNFWEVYHGEEFLTLTVDKLIELTKSDALQVEREEIVFKAVSRWYLHLPDQRKPIFPKVL